MIRALVIIEAEHLEAAREQLQGEPFGYPPELAAETFVPAGSPTGEEPATHWWLSTVMSAAKWDKCQELCEEHDWAWRWEYDMDQEPGFPDGQLAMMGLERLKTEEVPPP